MNPQNIFRIVIALLLTAILITQIGILYRMPNGNEIIAVGISNKPLRVDVDPRIPISVSIDQTPLPVEIQNTSLSVEIENILPVSVDIDNTPLPVQIHP